MNTYRITYTEMSTTTPIKFTEVEVGTQEAKNGIEAIKALLTAKGVSAEDLMTGRSTGSNKRLVLAGITFTARKIS